MRRSKLTKEEEQYYLSLKKEEAQFYISPEEKIKKTVDREMREVYLFCFLFTLPFWVIPLFILLDKYGWL